MNFINKLSAFLVFVFLFHAAVFRLGADPAPQEPRAPTGCWPQAGGNAQRTGYTPDSPAPFEAINKKTGLPVMREGFLGNTQPALYYPVAWAARFYPEKIYLAQPVIAEGRLFIGTLQGNFYALDAKTGERLWAYSTHESKIGKPIPMTAAVDKGRVFFGGMDFHVYALDAASGGELWKTGTVGPVSAAPAVAADTVFIGDRWGNFYALDAGTGAKKWQTRLSFVIDCTAAYNDGRVFVITEDQTLWCLAAADGKQLWTFKAPGGGFYRGHYPVVHNGCVMFRNNTQLTGHRVYTDMFAPFCEWATDEEKAADKELNASNSHARNIIGMTSRQIQDAMQPGGSGEMPEIVVEAQANLEKYYAENEWEQTFYVVDEKTGQQKFRAIHQTVGGYNGCGLLTPAVFQDGTVAVPLAWSGTAYARLDLEKNRLKDILVEVGATNCDEEHFISSGGTRIFIKKGYMGGCTIECVFDYKTRLIAQFMGLTGDAKKIHKPSILTDVWSPGSLTHGPRAGFGSIAIAGDMFYKQERATVTAWTGKEAQ